MVFVCFLYICWWVINQIKAINDTLSFNFHLRSEKYCVLSWVWSVDGGDSRSVSWSPSCVAVTWSHVHILEPNLKRRLAVSRYIKGLNPGEGGRISCLCVCVCVCVCGRVFPLDGVRCTGGVMWSGRGEGREKRRRRRKKKKKKRERRDPLANGCLQSCLVRLGIITRTHAGARTHTHTHTHTHTKGQQAICFLWTRAVSAQTNGGIPKVIDINNPKFNSGIKTRVCVVTPMMCVNVCS